MSPQNQWQHHTRVCQGKCPGSNIFALAVALAVISGKNRIIYQDILTALADAANDLSMPCHEHWAGTATARNASSSILLLYILKLHTGVFLQSSYSVLFNLLLLPAVPS